MHPEHVALRIEIKAAAPAAGAFTADTGNEVSYTRPALGETWHGKVTGGTGPRATVAWHSYTRHGSGQRRPMRHVTQVPRQHLTAAPASVTIRRAGSMQVKAARRWEAGWPAIGTISADGEVVEPHGHLGIARDDMPQLTGPALPGTAAAELAGGAGEFADLRDAFEAALQRDGIAVTHETAPATSLKPVQSELNRAKVERKATAIRRGTGAGVDSHSNPVMVAADNRIIDGHHKWAADMLADPARPVHVRRIGLPARQVLARAHRFARQMGIEPRTVSQTLAAKVLPDGVMQVKVGPGGYAHGWVFVGAPGGRPHAAAEDDTHGWLEGGDRHGPDPDRARDAGELNIAARQPGDERVSLPFIGDSQAAKVLAAADGQAPDWRYGLEETTREDVPLDHVYSMQPWVNSATVAKYAAAGGGKEPLMFKAGGAYFIANGTHRAEAAHRSGAATVPAHVISLRLPAADKAAPGPGQAGAKTFRGESLEIKVGPHGYIHGWVFVGIPVAGARVHHPEHGPGTVHTSVAGRVDVHFQRDGQTRSFAVRHDTGPNHFEKMTDEQVLAHLGNGTGEGFRHAMAELDRRDRADREGRTRDLYATTPASKEHADEIYGKLTGLGENPEDAWAHAYGKNTEQMRRDASIAQLRAQGYTGAGFHELTARAFKDDAQRRAVGAEKAIQGGVLLNRAGVAAGVDPWNLFTGPEATARKYASDELKAHWDQPEHRRETLDEYRERVLGRGRKESTFAKGGDWLQ